MNKPSAFDLVASSVLLDAFCLDKIASNKEHKESADVGKVELIDIVVEAGLHHFSDGELVVIVTQVERGTSGDSIGSNYRCRNDNDLLKVPSA